MTSSKDLRREAGTLSANRQEMQGQNMNLCQYGWCRLPWNSAKIMQNGGSQIGGASLRTNPCLNSSSLASRMAKYCTQPDFSQTHSYLQFIPFFKEENIKRFHGWSLSHRGEYITNPNNALFYSGKIPQNFPARFASLWSSQKRVALNDPCPTSNTFTLFGRIFCCPFRDLLQANAWNKDEPNSPKDFP